MNLPQEVNRMLDALLSGIQQVLEDNLVAVTERPVNDSKFSALVTLHAQLAALPNPYADRLEMAYIDRAALRRFEPGQRHPTLGQGETLAWSEHCNNWVLERWTLREHGVALLGPDPQSLIDPISSEDLRAAVRARLRDWGDWANRPDDPDWLLPRRHKAYVVETMCRALYTLACGELSSKERAVAWAIETLPRPWRLTVERSRAWRTDDTIDPAIAPEVRRFVLWAASDGEGVVRGELR
jgi:hypothetical protein